MAVSMGSGRRWLKTLSFDTQVAATLRSPVGVAWRQEARFTEHGRPPEWHRQGGSSSLQAGMGIDKAVDWHASLC